MRVTERPHIVAVILAIIIAVLGELFLFMSGKTLNFQGAYIPLFEQQYQFSTVGYSVDGNKYIATSNDPQIIISDVNQVVRYVAIEFGDQVADGTIVEVFYASEKNEFSQDYSSCVVLDGRTSNCVVLEIPEAEYESLRVDINGNFSLKEIYLSTEQVFLEYGLLNPFSGLRFITIALGLTIFLFVILYWIQSEKTEKSLTRLEVVFLICIFFYYVVWAKAQPYNYAPDEAMRYEVTKFFFENNRLPVGDELTSIWGFSYAHLPTMLCNQLGYIFMKIASIFKQTDFFLLMAARMVSVCAATGGVYFIIKMAKQLFSSPVRWIAIILFSCMPQYCFLASYVNNDILAVLGISMIVYSWILAIRTDWNKQNAVLLSIGISVCALSYYNSYPWVLFSMFVVTFTYLHKHKGDYKGFVRMAAFMCVIVLILIGYNFVRHVALYGDLTGFQTTEKYGELYAIDSLKPSLRSSLYEQGVSLSTMLFDAPYQWVRTSLNSFIAVFGYMQFFAPEFVYQLIIGCLLIGVVGLGVYVLEFINGRKMCNVEMLIFYVSMMLCSVIVIGLSLVYSYLSGFQPQGRYCYPMFVAAIVFVAKGYEVLVRKIKQENYKYAVVSAVCTTWIVTCLSVYFTVYLPT